MRVHAKRAGVLLGGLMTPALSMADWTLRFERRYRLHSGAHRALVTLTVRDSKGYSLIGAPAPGAFEDLREPFERLADSAVWR